MNLRPYQADCIDACHEAWKRFDRLLVVMATGLGKTHVFGHIAADGGKVLVLAHMRILVEQAADKIERIAGMRPQIEMGDQRVTHNDHFWGASDITVASRPSMARRLDNYSRDHFGTIIIDEAHHATVKNQYGRIVEYFDKAKVLGVTATPKRHDGTAAGQFWDHVPFSMELADGIDEGWLVEPLQIEKYVRELDFSRVDLKGKDFDEASLEEEMRRHSAEIAKEVVAEANKLCGTFGIDTCPTLVYSTRVASAEVLANVLSGCGFQSSCIHGGTPNDERNYLLSQHCEGSLSGITNCGVLLEGADLPWTALIANTRPTKSLPLYQQIVGRSVRPVPGIVDGLNTAAERKAAIAASTKPYAVMLDFTGRNAAQHKLCRLTDVLGGDYLDDDREDALAMALDGKMSVREALRVAEIYNRWSREQAKHMAKLRAEEEAVKRQKEEEERQRQRELARHMRDVDVTFGSREVDMFAAGDSVPQTQQPKQNGNPPTENMLRALERYGYSREVTKHWTKGKAGAVIGQHGQILKRTQGQGCQPGNRNHQTSKTS